MNEAAASQVQIDRAASGQGAILFDRRRFAQVDPQWARPSHWNGASSPHGQGGRGAVWMVQGEFGEGVLRHYRRGGLFGRFVRDRYLWRGEEATRCFREFRLLAQLHALGLPVPAPLIGGYVRAGAFYRADLLTGRIADARTLAQRLHERSLTPEDWRRVGATLARFHAHGVYHADLNAHNVLFDARAQVWLLDFDRGELRRPAAGWVEANLVRLRRSLLKLGAAADAHWPDAWRTLCEAHANARGGEPTPARDVA